MLDAERIERWLAETRYEGSRAEYPKDFPELPALPAGRYTDPEFFELEKRSLWQRSWLYAGHVDELPEPGSFFLWRKTGSPILVVRGGDGEIRAFYNTCQHRGAPVVREERGTLGKTFACGYHGWTYDLEGKLRAFPDRRDFVDFDPACRSLAPVRCERFANWIFLTENPEAEPLEEFLEPIARFFRHLPLDELRLVSTRTVPVACNYKVLLENFLEAYHFRLLHPGTTDRIFDQKATAIHLWERGHSMMLSPHTREGWVDPGTVGLRELAGTTAIEQANLPSYNLFPNFIVPIQTSGIGAVLIWPVDLKNSLLDVVWFGPGWDGDERPPVWDVRIANFDRIVQEDTSFAEPMQESLETGGFRGVPLNYQERRIYHWHEELDRRIGRERVPEHLRVEPLLDTYIER